LPEPVLTLRGVRKSYGPTAVLRGVDLDLHAGEVHVLAGENGAGKSTLIKILAGALPDHEGDVRLDGRTARFASPSAARAAGVSTIFQELSLVGTMSVADNLFLGRERRGPFGVRRAEQRALASQHLHALGLESLARQVDDEVDTLPLAQRQLVEIAKALLTAEREGGRAPRVVIMDEPSSALGEQEAEALFAQVVRLRAAGCAVLYVSHKMEEVYRLADRITALRDGTIAASAPARELPRPALVAAMLGRALEDAPPTALTRPATDAPARLRVEGLTVEGAAGARRELDDVSFAVAPGEIVAVAGLAGSGASALLHALFGSLARPRGAIGGRVRLDGAPYDGRSPSASLARGVALLSNDRRDAGILPERSVVENAALATLDRFARFGVIAGSRLRTTVLEALRALDVRAPSPDTEIAALSDGNQQKVLLARCALAEPTLLLLDEPTRGVDVGSKHEIHARMRGWCAAGAAILAITTEAEELLAVADRCVVLHRGRLAATIQVRGADPAEVRRRVLSASMGAAADPIVGASRRTDSPEARA
jgi:ABC-type sugar transport system ATPase subunit